MKIFYTDGTNKFGPFSIEELKAKGLSNDTKVWYFGLEKWTPIAQLDELKEITQTIPTPKQLNTVEIIQPQENPIKCEKELKNKINTTTAIVIALGIVIFIVLCFLIFRDDKETKLYKQIVASSYSTDEDFNFYIDKFYRDVKLYNLFPQRPETLIVKFADLDKIAETTHIHGMSFGKGNDKKIEIYINPNSWREFKRGGKYWLIYHELAHDVLNVDDLPLSSSNYGKLMYPKGASYEHQSMDEFIEASHQLFEEIAKKREKR